MNEPQKHTVPLGRLLRSVSAWVGMAATGVIVVYLMFASAAPRWTADLLGIPLFAPKASVQTELFVYPPFLVAIAVFLAAMIVAHLASIPLNLRTAGAWLSHVGVLLLAGGAGWYTLTAQSGDSISMRLRGGGWSPVEHVYLDRSFALYASDARDANAAPAQQDLGPLVPRGKPQPLDVPVESAPDGVSVRAVQFIPKARLTTKWADVSPNRIPAVELEVSDSGESAVLMLSRSLPGRESITGRGYVLTYRAGITPRGLARFTTPTDANQTPGMPYDLAILCTGSQIEPTLAVIHPDGSRFSSKLVIGETIEAPLNGRTVRMTPRKFYEHAAEIYEVANDAPDHPGHMAQRDQTPPGPVLEVEVVAGDFRRTTYLLFSAYEHIFPPQMMDLPGNRAIWLSFSRRRVALPATINVRDAIYETYPASGIPKDYICRLDISSGAQRRSETLSLNNPVMVGGFQFSQGSWAPPGQKEPTQIVFGAASRPALPAIWLGCLLICLGMPYAFYIKPLLMRRRAAA